VKKIAIIVAMSNNQVIGVDNSLPWHISEDLKRFKQLTTGYPIIMGRKTYQSIGRPLPNRHNIVVTRDVHLKISGVDVTNSIESALGICKNSDTVFIIGGGMIYNLALPYVNYLYITQIDSSVDGDAFFPDFDKSLWEEVSRRNSKDSDGTSFSFVDYKKI
jgi:dihydrofolate reductase